MLLAAVATGVLFGLVPALQVPVYKFRERLQDAGRESSGSSHHGWFRDGLVISEFALAWVLLVGAALLIRSFLRILDVNLGFQPERTAALRSAFAARFKELLGQTPLDYVTEWRMQKAMQLLQQCDKKLIDVARSVGYESDAAFSKAFKRVVGASPGEYLKRGFVGQGNAGMAEDL